MSILPVAIFGSVILLFLIALIIGVVCLVRYTSSINAQPDNITYQQDELK